LWLRAISASRPFCCTACGRRAWSAVPEDAAPVVALTAPVDEVDDVSLAALDAILIGLPPAGSVAPVDQLLLDDDAPASKRGPRVAPKRPAARRRRGADGSATGTPLRALSGAS